MKQITYDKPRIASTIIISVILTTMIFFAAVLFPINWQAIKDAQSSGSVTGDVAVALVLGTGIILVGFVYALIFLGCGPLFLFSFKNRRSTYKAIRIISYVLDGIIISLAVLSLVKFILIVCGI